MTLEAIIFGGIGTLTECADIDRQAWNSAFRVHDVPWDWSWDVYAELMRAGGNRPLVHRYVAATSQACGVPADVLDATHQKVFASRLARSVPLRPGVARVLSWSARAGVNLGLVSRSEGAPVRALLQATARERSGIEFDVAVLRGDVDDMAPHPAAMERAVRGLGVGRNRVAVVADTPAMAQAAQEAGLPVLAFPGQMASGSPSDFGTLPQVSVLTAEAVTGVWYGDQAAAAQ